MRKFHIALAAMFLAFAGSAFAQTAPTIVMPDAVKWTPGTGMMKGTDVAILQGDPAKAGMYIMRLRLPANTTFAPHFHGDAENVTVISGVLYVGLGDSVDESKAQALGPGAFVSVPPNVHHFALTKVPTIIQIEGIGPTSMTAVTKM